jgi:hypothetical protein
LLFSKPTIGSPSKLFVIPVGMQISTKLFPRAGTIAVGLHINRLVNLIELRTGKYSRFMIVDNRNEEFAFGSNPVLKIDKRNVANLPFLIDGNVYIKARNMSQEYPYKILTGYDRSQFWIEVISNSLLLFLQVVAVVFIIFFLKQKN